MNVDIDTYVYLQKSANQALSLFYFYTPKTGMGLPRTKNNFFYNELRCHYKNVNFLPHLIKPVIKVTPFFALVYQGTPTAVSD